MNPELGPRSSVLCQFRTALLCLALLTLAATNGYGQQTPGTAYDDALKRALIGTWRGEIGGVQLDLALGEDGTYQIGGSRGSYTVTAGTLSLIGDSTVTYAVAMAGRDSLTLSGGDLGSPAKLQKAPDARSLLTSSLRIDPGKVVEKLISIGVILAIVLASRFILWLFKLLSRFLILSERGPLRYIYRGNKNRTRTVHSLVLDILKYIVYFTAFGFMLSELGVNYTAYLASLSVIGLAIGFGSQGLVQDIVTGFFLVFEDQFNVGDMVEISAQVGLVQEMGLRMTRIKNYAGQIVFIPNRNIAIAGRYLTGALEGYVDFEIPEEKLAEVERQFRGVMARLVEQFDDVFLRDGIGTDRVSLEAHGTLLRCWFAIWPGQTWIIDQQLIPRLRDVLAQETVKLGSVVLTVCYHKRHDQEVIGVAASISRLRHRIARKRESESDNK